MKLKITHTHLNVGQQDVEQLIKKLIEEGIDSQMELQAFREGMKLTLKQVHPDGKERLIEMQVIP